MIYKVSPVAPPAVVGRALPLRIKLKGRKIQKRPNPISTVKQGVLPRYMKTTTKIQLKPVSI